MITFRLLYREADRFGSKRDGYVQVRVISGLSGLSGVLVLTSEEWADFKQMAMVAGFQVGPDTEIV